MFTTFRSNFQEQDATVENLSQASLLSGWFGMSPRILECIWSSEWRVHQALRTDPGPWPQSGSMAKVSNMGESNTSSKGRCLRAISIGRMWKPHRARMYPVERDRHGIVHCHGHRRVARLNGEGALCNGGSEHSTLKERNCRAPHWRGKGIEKNLIN